MPFGSKIIRVIRRSLARQYKQTKFAKAIRLENRFKRSRETIDRTKASIDRLEDLMRIDKKLLNKLEKQFDILPNNKLSKEINDLKKKIKRATDFEQKLIDEVSSFMSAMDDAQSTEFRIVAGSSMIKTMAWTPNIENDDILPIGAMYIDYQPNVRGLTPVLYYNVDYEIFVAWTQGNSRGNIWHSIKRILPDYTLSNPRFKFDSQVKEYNQWMEDKNKEEDNE